LQLGRKKSGLPSMKDELRWWNPGPSMSKVVIIRISQWNQPAFIFAATSCQTSCALRCSSASLEDPSSFSNFHGLSSLSSLPGGVYSCYVTQVCSESLSIFCPSDFLSVNPYGMRAATLPEIWKAWKHHMPFFFTPFSSCLYCHQ
jgi:hypothetical protein